MLLCARHDRLIKRKLWRQVEKVRQCNRPGTQLHGFTRIPDGIPFLFPQRLLLQNGNTSNYFGWLRHFIPTCVAKFVTPEDNFCDRPERPVALRHFLWPFKQACCIETLSVAFQTSLLHWETFCGLPNKPVALRNLLWPFKQACCIETLSVAFQTSLLHWETFCGLPNKPVALRNLLWP